MQRAPHFNLVMMLLKKRKKEDPLLVELSRLKENIETQVAQLEMNIKAIKEKQDELNKVADILETDASEKSQKLSSENEDSSENNLQNNPQSEEKTFDSIKVCFSMLIQLTISEEKLWCHNYGLVS